MRMDVEEKLHGINLRDFYVERKGKMFGLGQVMQGLTTTG
jgi:hypothetical protein